jgi:hypothetical protein
LDISKNPAGKNRADHQSRQGDIQPDPDFVHVPLEFRVFETQIDIGVNNKKEATVIGHQDDHRHLVREIGFDGKQFGQVQEEDRQEQDAKIEIFLAQGLVIAHKNRNLQTDRQ